MEPSQGEGIEIYGTPNLQHPLLPSLPSYSSSPDIVGTRIYSARAASGGVGEIERKRKREIREAYYKAGTAGLPSLSYSQ